MEATTLRLRFVVEGEQQAQAALENTDRKVSGFAAKAGTFGAALTAGVTVPLIGMGIAAFRAASDTNESMSKVNVVFGESSGIVTNWASTAATQIGLSQTAALSAAGTFGVLFTNMGFGQEAAAGMSTEIVGLATDLASFNNVPVDQALEAIRSGLVGETEPLRQFGVMLDEATIKAEALRLGLWSGEGALTANAKAQAILSLITQQTATAQGDFARTSDGAANQMKIVQAQVSDLAATFGAQLLPIGISVLSNVNNLLAGFQGLSPNVQQAIMVVAGLAAAAGPLLMALSAVVTVAPAVGAAFTLMTGPIGLVAVGLAALFVAYQTNFLGFADGVNAAVDGIVSEFNTLKDAFSSDGISGVFDKLGEQIGNIDWETIGVTIGEGAKSAGGAIISGLVSGIQEHGVDVLTFLGVELPLLIAETWFTANVWLLSSGAELINGLILGITGVDLGATISGVITTILTPFLTVAEWLPWAGEALISGMSGGINNAVAGVLALAIGGAVGGVIAPFADSGSWLWNAGWSLMNGLKDGIAAGWEEVKGFLGSLNPANYKGPPERDRRMLIENGILTMRGYEEGLQKGWQQVTGTLGTMTPSIGGASFGSVSSVSPFARVQFAPVQQAGAPYYDLRGSIIGGDIDRYINDRIANGQGRRIDRSIARSRLAETYR